MIRVVLDTNVLVSGLLTPSGSCARILSAVTDGRVDIVVCDTLLHEVHDVLSRPKIVRYLDRDTPADFTLWLARFATVRPDPAPAPAETADPKDDYLVALARENSVTLLVSGDTHLLGVASVSPRVISPAAFDRLLEELG